MRWRTRFILLAVIIAACSGCDSGGPNAQSSSDGTAAAEAVRAAAVPIGADTTAYDQLLSLVGDANIVLLGEASHGTEEFYRERARITQRLILEKGFSAVAVEGDWPDAFRVNEYVRGLGGDASAAASLGGFTDFPRWMWRNTAVADFASWLRTHNASVDGGVSFYGLDLYSLYPSIQAVEALLDGTDPDLAAQVRSQYACFSRAGTTAEAYGQAVGSDLSSSCQSQAAAAADAIREWADDAPAAATLDAEQMLNLLRNAELVTGAELYYRAAYRGGPSTWNIRDAHMAETVDAILGHLSAAGRSAKVVIWAHNSHVGDARATDQGARGDVTLGQLVRQQHSGTVSVGFTTYTGTVRAASNWGEEPQLKQVRPALPESYEALFHSTGVPNFLLPLRGSIAEQLAEARLERAIGVVYRPETERASHYFEAELSKQFDAVIHLDETRAVEPLDADQLAAAAAVQSFSTRD